MIKLTLQLEARDPARRCFRSYGIAGGQDLFGAWLVEMSYGRVGTTGRTRTRSFANREQATTAIETCLRQRATAPRRIGVAYRLCQATYEPEWPGAVLEQSMQHFDRASGVPVANG